MKTTIDIPDDLVRLARTRAAMSGISLRKLVTDTLRAHLGHGENLPEKADPPWMAGFGALGDLGDETARIKALIEEEFEQIDAEPQR